MKNIMKNRLALSTVVTTLIILVVSVLLAGVVTYFAINVTSTRVQEEAYHFLTSISGLQLTGSGSGAIMVTNTGGRDVSHQQNHSTWTRMHATMYTPITATAC